MTATDNAGNALTNMGGIWVLGLDAGQSAIQFTTAGSLYNSNQFSYGTYGGSCPVLFYSQLKTPAGYGIGGAWVNAGTNSIDVSSFTKQSFRRTLFPSVLSTNPQVILKLNTNSRSL